MNFSFIELDDFEVEGVDARDAFEFAACDRWAWEPLHPRREDYYIALMDQHDDLELASRFFDELLAQRDAEIDVLNPERVWTRKRRSRRQLLLTARNVDLLSARGLSHQSIEVHAGESTQNQA